MKFISFAILALNVCIYFGEIGRSTNLAKLFGCQNSFDRRVVILIIMVIFCIIQQSNNAFIDLTDDLFLQGSFFSMIVLQTMGFSTCVIFAYVCGVTFVAEKTK
jgi:hypothetical protein